MKLKTPLMSHRARGTLQKQLVFRRGGRGHSVYPLVKPKQPGTAAQTNRHTLWTLLANRWSNFTADEKDQWHAQASSAGITNYNAYLKYNLARLSPAVPDGLIAWWPNVHPFGDVLHDIAPDHYDGDFVTLNPAVAWQYDPTRRGIVLDFDGTGHVNVPTIPQFVDPFSVTGWVQMTSPVSSSAVIDCGHSNQWTFCYIQPTTFMMWVYGAHVHSTTPPTAPVPWTHIANVWDGTHLRISVNGTEEGTQADSDPPRAAPTMWIGKFGVEYSDYIYQGRIDDLRIYNRPLTQPEIQALAAM